MVGETAGTEAKLLLAAERLFAEHGVGAVSLRAVMQEAGTNVAAVHYHFGSKKALLDAVVRHRIDSVSAARAELVGRSGSAAPDARELAAAFIDPIVRLAEDGGRDWIRLVGRLLATDDPALAPLSETFLARNAAFVALVERLDPTASSRTIAFRLTQAMTLALRVVGDLEQLQGLLGRDGERWTPDDVLAELLDVVTSIIAGPRGHTASPDPHAIPTTKGD